MKLHENRQGVKCEEDLSGPSPEAHERPAKIQVNISNRFTSRQGECIESGNLLDPQSKPQYFTHALHHHTPTRPVQPFGAAPVELLEGQDKA